MEPNGHLSTKLKLAVFFGTGPDLLSGFIMSKHVYANFEAVAVFCYEQSSICSFVIFKVNF